jgi:hypothetical protein
MNGNRTLFECNQFRGPPKTSDDNLDEPSESSVIRKRSLQQESPTTTIPKK